MTTPPTSVDVDGTIGATFTGLVLSTLLFGILTLQVYVYYTRYPKDWVVYRVSVAAMWFLGGLNLIFAIHAVYHYLVRNFGNYDELDVIVWSFKAQNLTNVMVVVMVQSLYTVRLWRLNVGYRKRWYPKLVPLIVALGIVVGVLITIESFRLNTFSQLEGMKWAAYSSFIAAAAVDTFIAVAMICYLQSSRTDHDGTNNTLTTLVVWVMGTGATTSLCSLLALITYAYMPKKFVFLAIGFLLPKLYANSFLAFLNARNYIKRQSSAVAAIEALQSEPSPGITIPKHDVPSHPLGRTRGGAVPTILSAGGPSNRERVEVLGLPTPSPALGGMAGMVTFAHLNT